MTTKLSRGFRGATLAGFMALALSANASVASANVVVCNNYTKEIRFTATVNDTSSCSGNWRQKGWWAIPAFQCRTLSGLGDMTNKTLWSFIRALDGRVWDGGGAHSWSVPNDAHEGCFSNIQLSCTNAGANCTTRSHRGSTISSKDVTITVSL